MRYCDVCGEVEVTDNHKLCLTCWVERTFPGVMEIIEPIEFRSKIKMRNSYEVGDRVRLKVLSRYDLELAQSINDLPDRTATIKQVNNNKGGMVSYNLEEIGWEIGNLEIQSLAQRWEDRFEPIENRWEILDIR